MVHLVVFVCNFWEAHNDVTRDNTGQIHASVAYLFLSKIGVCKFEHVCVQLDTLYTLSGISVRVHMSREKERTNVCHMNDFLYCAHITFWLWHEY